MFPPGPYGGYSAVPTQQPINAQQIGQALASLGGLAALAGPAPDWGRIHEVGPPRTTRVTYQDEVPPPESILRRSSSRRNLGGLSRSNSFHSVHEGTGQATASAPPSPRAGRAASSSTMSPAIRELMDRIEAENNVTNQLQ